MATICSGMKSNLNLLEMWYRRNFLIEFFISDGSYYLTSTRLVRRGQSIAILGHGSMASNNIQKLYVDGPNKSIWQEGRDPGLILFRLQINIISSKVPKGAENFHPRGSLFSLHQSCAIICFLFDLSPKFCQNFISIDFIGNTLEAITYFDTQLHLVISI